MSENRNFLSGQEVIGQNRSQIIRRRIMALTLCLLFLLAAATFITTPQPALAQSAPSIYINDEQIYPDIAPYVYLNRTMVPLRLISETMGYTCNWDNSQKEVFIQNEERSLYLWTGESTGLFNGQKFTCDVAPQVAGQRVMVPLRLVSESMGGQVNYFSASNSIYITCDTDIPVDNGTEEDQGTSIRLMVTYDVVNLRQGPGTNYAITGQVALGDVLSATDKTGDWYKVDGGYVRQDLVYVLSDDSASRGDEDELAGIIIVLDPGHGKINDGYSDPGAMGPSGLKEREVNLAITAYTIDFLRRMGAEVITTNMSDNYLSLADRAAFASYYDADIFVSIHSNSNTSSLVCGTGVYRNSASSYANQDKLLGQKIEDSLVAALDRRKVGVIAGSFGVLRDLSCPGVIVEVAFISNPAEEALLASDDFRQKAAMAIACGIRNYFVD